MVVASLAAALTFLVNCSQNTAVSSTNMNRKNKDVFFNVNQTILTNDAGFGTGFGSGLDSVPEVGGNKGCDAAANDAGFPSEVDVFFNVHQTIL